MTRTIECPICGSKDVSVSESQNFEWRYTFHDCPVCGRYDLMESDLDCFNINHLMQYMFYNAFKHNLFREELRYYTTLDKEKCDAFKKNLENGDRTNGLPVHLDNDIVEAWYPKTFAERIDRILLYLNSRVQHLGESIRLSNIEVMSLLFVDRKERDSFSQKMEWRKDNLCKDEKTYLLKYLKENNLVQFDYESSDQQYTITISPKGYARIDEIQKATSYGRKVLVAMKFGNDTVNLREAIRKGIEDSGYFAVFIDEVQYNDFITPELLKHIRDSKFVVADLTHQNNGAYFEEGYAMGLGKQVIQLCQKDTKLHFDIAQKNTIMWEKEEDIPLKLTNRINATID